jgi:flavin reductase (DIM6/NTAB) family NADH-FMN oxidoreductase RutF
MEINVEDYSSSEVYNYLTHLIAPRPIALVSTISRDGVVNLSPFSFFNMFSASPPIVIFSALRRMRNNTTKHTFNNVMEVPEVVINIVTRDIARQASLASSEYDDGVDEFIKAGFDKEKAILIRPPMVQQAKAKLECKVIEIKPLGKGSGAGNLVICEVIYIHISGDVLGEDNAVSQEKLHLAARLGGNWYADITEANLFSVPKPAQTGIGIDNLPGYIRRSTILTGHDLALLAAVEQIPDFDPGFTDSRIVSISRHCRHSRELQYKEISEYAIELLNKNEVQKAWQVLGKIEALVPLTNF